MKLIRTFLICGAALLCVWGSAAQQSGSPGDYIVSRDTPSWFKQSFLDFEEDVAEAAEADKRVMIYFGQDGCPYCRRLHETSLKDSEIVDLLTSHFDSVAVNIFGDVETVWTDGETASEKELSARLSVQFTPTLIFLDEDGNIIVRVNGYRTPGWMRTALHYVAEKKDRDGILFADYMRRAAAAGDKAAAKTSLTDKFLPPNGDLHAPGQRTMIFVAENDCAMCDEWRKYLHENAGKWDDTFRLVALNRFGDRAAAEGVNEAEWSRRMQIAFTPALIFIEPDGSEIFRAEAYLRPFHLETVVEYARAGATKADPEFQRFLQSRADNIRDGGGTVTIW